MRMSVLHIFKVRQLEKVIILTRTLVGTRDSELLRPQLPIPRPLSLTRYYGNTVHVQLSCW